MLKKKALTRKTTRKRRVRLLVVIAVSEFLLLVLFGGISPFIVNYWEDFSESYQELEKTNSNLTGKVESLSTFIQNMYPEPVVSRKWEHGEGISFLLPPQWNIKTNGSLNVAFYDERNPLKEDSCFVYFLDNPEQLTIQQWLSQDVKRSENGDQKIELINSFQGLSVDQPISRLEGGNLYSYYVRKGKRIFQFSYVYQTAQNLRQKLDYAIAAFYSNMCRKILNTLQIE